MPADDAVSVESFHLYGDLLEASWLFCSPRKGARVIAVRNGEGKVSGFIASADAEPSDPVAAVEKVANVKLEAVLWLDEGALSVREVFESGSIPVPMICTDVDDVFRVKAELLE